MSDIGVVGFILGTLYALLIAAIFSPRLISGVVVEDTWLRFALRFALALAVTLPWRLISTLVKRMHVHNHYFNLFFGGLLPDSLQAFFLFYVADRLSH